MSRILLVDDDVDLAELIKTKLAGEGHEVHTIHSGDGAFELAKQVKPEIMLLDVMLPGVNGYQICRRIRKDPELYGIGILILTALGEEPEIMHGLEQGADDYLSKPFRFQDLTEKIVAMIALLESVRKKNPLTGLPGTEAVKREINHRLARGDALAVCYVDIVGFKAYVSAYGQPGQKKALEFMGGLISSLCRNMGIYESFSAHMGGEHFVILMRLEDFERFCNTLMQTFDQRVRELFPQKEAQQGYFVSVDRRGKEAKCPLMALAIGVAHTEHRQYKSAKKLFEVLAQTRQKAQPTEPKSVMFIDRRKADR